MTWTSGTAAAASLLLVLFIVGITVTAVAVAGSSGCSLVAPAFVAPTTREVWLPGLLLRRNKDEADDA